MFVYISPSCRQEAQIHNKLDKLTSLKTSIQTHSITAIQSHFDWNYPYLKHRFHNLRLIGKIQKIGNDRVFCFVKIFQRGQPDYEHHFLDNPDQYGETHFQLNILDIEREIQYQKEALTAEQQPKHLPSHLKEWLHKPSLLMDSQGGAIYETRIWVEQFKTVEIDRHWQTYHELVYSLIEAHSSQLIQEQATSYDGVFLGYHPTRQKAILFSRIEAADSPGTLAILLICPFAKVPSSREIDSLGVSLNLYGPGLDNRLTHSLSRNDIAQYSLRYYPRYLLLDPDIWYEIEREAQGNFALSLEEETILEAGKLPIFINGRAGSGKSTMLFYLFAYYCQKYMDIREHNPDLTADSLRIHPLFITYNKRLLQSARQGVRKLLNHHHHFAEKSIDIDFQTFFTPFQEFLLKRLDSETLQKFDSDKYISFYQFEQAYKSSFPGKLSPAECWHIIRAFIKGYNLEDMAAEDYSDIPRRERTVPEDSFKFVCDRVYPWYKNHLRSDGFWDDQDLIREVLKQGNITEKYSALVFDEAQDFTKLELRLLVQLSIFTDYELHPPVESLPFAFAGDPLQTLNPTGFRWKSVRAAFYEQVIASLDPDRHLKIQMTFHELKSNYRSLAAIVRLTNLILLWRYLFFNSHQLTLQVPWKPGDGIPPQKFILSQNVEAAQFRDLCQNDPIILIPCEEGGELNYLQHDDLLRDLFPDIQQDKLPKNILSASQAKGLEFPFVILYKFGEELANRQTSLDQLYPDHQRNLELEYFFNKLYVAASRPTEALVILDSPAGEQALWQFADHNGCDRAIQASQLEPRDAAQISPLPRGESFSIFNRDNRLEQAEQFWENGLSQENPEFLHRAADFYRSLNAYDKAEICQAWALKFERQFRAAGERFLQLNKPEEARKCFWQGLCWPQLWEWHQQHRGSEIEGAIAQFMVTQPASLRQLQNFSQQLDNHINQAQRHYTEKPWRITIEAYRDSIEAFLKAKQALSPSQWQQYGDSLECLAQAKYPHLLHSAGFCFYAAQTPENHRRAVDCWESCGATNHRDYYLAKAQQVGFPEGIGYLQQAEAHQQIVEIWENAGKPGKANWLKQLSGIRWALEQQQRFDDLVHYLLQARRWLEAIESLDRRQAPDHDTLTWEVVRQLATSNLTPDDTRPQRRRYVEFLKRVIENKTWSRHLTPAEVGASFERVGEWVPCLSFYEQFIENRQISPHWRRYAQRRWLATKAKQEQFAEGTNPQRAQDIRAEIERKARQWQFDPTRISPEPQPGEPNRLPGTVQIEGLPERVLLQRRENGARFVLAGMSVEAVQTTTSLQVSLCSRETEEAVFLKITRKGGLVRRNGLSLYAEDGSSLLFRLDQVCLGRLVYRGRNPRVEILVSGLDKRQRISIRPGLQ
ncbi:MAG: hypothetical protein R6U67_16210 [Sodalinema sp.]|uniref:hypothetical protein n=1 Tax=Sodalinema sp. TaxID=3080550 RepID=UPI001221595C|nr:MAG: hypothetical protein EYR95_08665 [Phormidium sp. SL48-SHIP]